jgi:MFS family permease
MTFVPLTFLATSKVDPSRAGLASGLFNTTQQVGGAFGLAILATLANNHTKGQITDRVDPAQALVSGWSLAFLIGAALIVLAFVASFARIRDEDADFEAGPAHIG